MLSQYLVLASVMVLGVLAADSPSQNTRSKGKPVRDPVADERRQMAHKEKVNKEKKNQNAGGHQKTGGLKPKRRSLDEIVRRAVDDALLEDSLYARAMYEEEDIFARDADFDDVYDLYY